MADHIKPGTDNKPAGKYHETGVNGEKLKNGKTVNIGKGDRLPPTQKPGRGWKK
ncbi:YjzC family protein [Fundicoccus sp. Sow4_F4]|uniref:YjzC family protein n=1 Tax=Fundicoccus sp. Sow4_F4 TaxID=3438783 RepID=UPI003F8EE207